MGFLSRLGRPSFFDCLFLPAGHQVCQLVQVKVSHAFSTRLLFSFILFSLCSAVMISVTCQFFILPSRPSRKFFTSVIRLPTPEFPGGSPLQCLSLVMLDGFLPVVCEFTAWDRPCQAHYPWLSCCCRQCPWAQVLLSDPVRFQQW